jgi:hypothetical protein
MVWIPQRPKPKHCRDLLDEGELAALTRQRATPAPLIAVPGMRLWHATDVHRWIARCGGGS